jgi:hypothetical protein
MPCHYERHTLALAWPALGRHLPLNAMSLRAPSPPDVEVLANLSDIVDTMTFNKNGHRNDFQETLKYMHWCQQVRQEVLETASSATERLELSINDVWRCLKQFTKQFLESDYLTTHQRKDRRFELKWYPSGDIQISSSQRAFINTILRNKLGRKLYAYQIWQYGLPRILSLALTAVRYKLWQMRVAFLRKIPEIFFPMILSFLIGDSTLTDLVALSQIISLIPAATVNRQFP